MEARLDPHVPWSYGRDKVVAMVVDPSNLFVFAEITDAAIEEARSVLDTARGEDVLVLRVHDVTGRIFDGTNSHSHFDLAIDRTDREWFLHVGRPGTTVVAEIGLRSCQGGFRKIARSRRATFARTAVGPTTRPTWLTVRVAPDGRPVPVPEAAIVPAAGGEQSSSTSGPWDVLQDMHLAPGGAEGELVPQDRSEWVRHQTWVETVSFETTSLREALWSEGPEVWTWFEGPAGRVFAMPVTVRRRLGGVDVFAFESGVEREVWGRWEEDLLNLGAWSERRQLPWWSLSWRYGSEEGWAVVPGGPGDPLGSSGWRWGRASELRLGGASEQVRRGASELRLGGASERRRRGASERRLVGASERRRRGASEWRFGGASERRPPGASQHRLGGASERYAFRRPDR